MISKQDFAMVDRKAVERDRASFREFYGTVGGREYLKQQVKESGIFARTDQLKDESIRNYVIGILERLGFLDEENIDQLVEFMFELPLISVGDDRYRRW